MTNTTLSDMYIGAVVRAHRTALGAWRIVSKHDGRVQLAHLFDAFRSCNASPAMSVWSGDLSEPTNYCLIPPC